MSMCSVSFMRFYRYASFFFNDTATPEIYTLSLHDALPISHTSPVASAQVKSAVLLAGLYADGPVSVHEPAPSRDHSERMLRRFGARLRAEGTAVRLEPRDLYGTTVHVPGDISSAAFLLVAAAIVRDAEVSVTRVGVNPTRTGILTVLEAMGAR